MRPFYKSTIQFVELFFKLSDRVESVLRQAERILRQAVIGFNGIEEQNRHMIELRRSHKERSSAFNGYSTGVVLYSSFWSIIIIIIADIKIKFDGDLFGWIIMKMIVNLASEWGRVWRISQTASWGSRWWANTSFCRDNWLAVSLIFRYFIDFWRSWVIIYLNVSKGTIAVIPRSF